jgi:hypothetical protein
MEIHELIPEGPWDDESGPQGAMTEDEKNELRLDQLDEAEELANMQQLEHDGACVACGRKDGRHNAGCPSYRFTGETIDITPVGMKTPEGNARVSKALDDYSASTALVAELASELLESLDHNGSIPSEYRKDEYKRVLAAAKDRLDKQEALLRAVAYGAYMELLWLVGR